MQPNIYNIGGHYNIVAASNSNLDIITKYDAPLKTFSSLDTIQNYQPHLLKPSDN